VGEAIMRRSAVVILVAGLTCLAAAAGGPRGADELENLWGDLATDDPVQAERALTGLAARPARAVPFLGQRLRPMPVPEPRRLARLLTDLDDDRYEAREGAMQELRRLAETAEPALKKALAGAPSPEARRRIEWLLGALREERLRPPADRRRAVRAVEVLERIGDAGARRVLAALARGAPEAQLTIEAKTALERLDRPAAGAP
jgi:hypothetical protein